MIDAAFLLTMLIGLLRDRNSAGIWKLLYQQVAPEQFLRVSLDTEFFLVYNLDSVGLDCRGTSCGLSLSAVPPLGDIQLTDLKVFLILNLNGVFLYFRFAHQCMKWD